MQTEIVTSENSLDPNVQTMPVDLAIIDESILQGSGLSANVIDNNSLATESVVPAISKSIDLNNLDLETFRLSSFPAVGSFAEPPLGTRIGIDDKSPTESAVNWESIQVQLSTSFENAKSYLAEFYKNSRQLLTPLGIIFLAIISVKVVFAGLSAIDSIPLFTPLLKVVGLFYLVRFIWRYLIREHDRQELFEILNRTKAEVLGSQN